MTSPNPPTMPDYNGAAAATTTSSSNPNDIWGLGDVYGKPVYLGTSQATGPYAGNGDLTKGNNNRGVTNQFGKTQDIIQQVVDMWSAQQAERKKNPNALTTYEQLQQALWSAGFFGQTSYKDIHVGQWTPQTQGAITSALTQYEQVLNSQQPITFTEFLSTNAAGPGAGGFGSDSSSPAAVISLGDPEAIKQAAQSAAQQALGMGLNDDQLNKFVAQFQAAQTSAQTGTGTVTQPDLSSDAMAFAQGQDPAAYKDNKRQSFLNSLVNMLSTGAQRPNMTPVPKAGG